MKEENKVVILPGRKPAYPGKKDFDKTYKTITIVDKVRKIGEGEDDFIIEKKVIVTEKPIKDVVEADKDNVGVENIMKQIMRTGDLSLLPIDRGDCNVDLVGAPESLMEVKQMGVDAEAAFKQLPDDIVNGMDMQSFVNSMTQEKFNEFIAAVNARAAGKEEVKDGE